MDTADPDPRICFLILTFVGIIDSSSIDTTRPFRRAAFALSSAFICCWNDTFEEAVDDGIDGVLIDTSDAAADASFFFFVFVFGGRL